jgi:hypothetical protein
MSVQVRNNSDVRAELPLKFSVEIEPERGDRFLLRSTSGSSAFDWPDGTTFEFSPGTTRNLDLLLGGGVTFGPFASEPRLWTPGHYRIRLILGEVASLPGEVSIEPLSGSELETWNAILELTKGRGLGSSIRTAPVIAARLYAQTELGDRYRPYLGAFGAPSDYDERAEFQETLLSEMPRSHPVWHQVKINNLVTRLRIADRDVRGGLDVDLAEVRRLRTELEGLAETAPTAHDRQSAKQALDRVSRTHVIEISEGEEMRRD